MKHEGVKQEEKSVNKEEIYRWGGGSNESNQEAAYTIRIARNYKRGNG